jgi:RNA polymerase sigma factor (sigma-70 family)
LCCIDKSPRTRQGPGADPQQQRVPRQGPEKTTQGAGASQRCSLERRNRLAVEHLEWALAVAARVLRALPTWFEKGDLSGPAALGLLKAAARYRGDPEDGRAFRAFAWAGVRGACIDAIRRRNYHPLATPLVNDDGPVAEAASHDPSPLVLVERAEERKIWDDVARLPARQAEVIRLVYGGDMRQSEAARALGVGESWLSQIHKAAIANLRGLLKAA